jgi:metal-responsive CopG/Arc/MetJ family transcriptional regulator
MKTAISLPDALFAEADSYAEQNGLSRSELYAKALQDYLRVHKRDDLTERIDAAIEGIDTKLSPEMHAFNKRRILESEW